MKDRDEEMLNDSPEPGVPGALDQDIEESYDAPERPLAMNRFGTTAQEYATGESLNRRIAAEEPETWEQDEAAARMAGEDADTLVESDEDELDPQGGRGTGRLAWAGDEGTDAPDTWARDTRSGAGEESSEEAAMHVIEDV